GESDKAAQRQDSQQEGQLAQLLQRAQAVAGETTDPLAQPASEPQTQRDQRQQRQPERRRYLDPDKRQQRQNGRDQQPGRRHAHRQRLGLAFGAGIGLGKHHA